MTNNNKRLLRREYYDKIANQFLRSKNNKHKLDLSSDKI